MDHSLAKDLLELAGFKGLEQIERSLDLKYVQICFDSNPDLKFIGVYLFLAMFIQCESDFL